MPRELEVWAVSDDGEYVLLAASEDASRATHQLRIDARLEAAVRGELEDDDERRESELSPKEIQSRLRAGDTVEQVAKVARVAVSRVMRYAGPVMSERDRIVDQARAGVVQRARGPQAETPLGSVVEKRLAATVGLRTESVTWTARRRDDGGWVVALSYTARGGARTAQWLWQPSSRELTSLNALGTRLGADDPPAPQRRKRPAPAPAAAPATRSSRPARKPATSRTAKAPAARTPRPRAATPSKSVRSKSVPSRSVTQPPARSRAKAAAAKPPPRRRPSRPVIEPVTKRSNGRVAVPSWDDVLLGVQSPAAARSRRRS